MKHALLTLCLTASLIGCATSNFTKPVDPKVALDPGKAYVYGSFNLNWPNAPALDRQLGAYPSIGLKFACDNGEAFVLGLAPRQPDQVIEVPAQRCSLKSLIFTGAMYGTVQGEKPVNAQILQNISFAPGTLHYVGDISGKVWQERSGNFVTDKWQVTSHVDGYEDTTRRVVAAQPALSSFRRVNLIGGGEKLVAR